MDVFEEIGRIHSACSMMDKASKILYLKGLWNSLNQYAIQMSDYFRKRSTITLGERECAQKLIDMMNEVQAEGLRTQRELAGEYLSEIVKRYSSIDR